MKLLSKDTIIKFRIEVRRDFFESIDCSEFIKEDNCIICLSDKSSYGFLDCKHVLMCSDCAEEYLKQNADNQGYTCCPMCRGVNKAKTIQFWNDLWKFKNTDEKSLVQKASL